MKLLGFDVETSGKEEGFGLQPFRARTGDAWLTSCALASKDAGAVVQANPDVAWMRRWLQRCAQKKITIVGWNTPFDMAWLIAMGLRDEVFACKWLDAMILWRHLTASPAWSGVAPQSYSLKAAVSTYLPTLAGYEDGIDFNATDEASVNARLEYNRKDAIYTLWLAEAFLQKLTPSQRKLVMVEAACLPMVAETYVEGIRVDVDAARALSEQLATDATVALVTLKMHDPEVDASVLASPAKLRELLYGKWGLPGTVYTDKGLTSTNRDALMQLAPVDHRANLLNTFRESTNNRTKFAEGLIKSAAYNGDGHVRPSARVYGTYTGRVTYSASILKGKPQRPTGVPIHQWKRAKAFRDMILAPEGYTLLEFDFSGQEFRWMAVFSGDETMLRMCLPGEDAHAFMGSRIGGVSYEALRKALKDHDPEAKDLRQFGKVGNLSCQYRTSPSALQRVARVGYQMDMGLAQARAIHATYRTTYPRVLRYWDQQIHKIKTNGYVETIAGRRVHFDSGVAELDNVWSRDSTAINFPIQGSGADQKYLALAVLKDYLTKVDGRLYFELHDGIYMIVPDAHAMRAVEDLKPMLSNLPYKQAFDVSLPISFPVDAKMGKTWGSMEEVEI